MLELQLFDRPQRLYCWGLDVSVVEGVDDSTCYVRLSARCAGEKQRVLGAASAIAGRVRQQQREEAVELALVGKAREVLDGMRDQLMARLEGSVAGSLDEVFESRVGPAVQKALEQMAEADEHPTEAVVPQKPGNGPEDPTAGPKKPGKSAAKK